MNERRIGSHERMWEFILLCGGEEEVSGTVMAMDSFLINFFIFSWMSSD